MSEPPPKKRVLSRTVHASVFDGDELRDSTETLDAIRNARLETELKRKQTLKAKPVDYQEQMEEAGLELGMDVDTGNWDEGGNEMLAPVMDDVDDTDPIEDGADTFQWEDDDRKTIIAQITSRRVRRYDRRTRHRRTQLAWNKWTEYMPQLVTSYLDFVRPESNPQPSTQETQSIYHKFHVRKVGTHEYDARISVEQRKEELANVALLRQGLLGCSPVEPHVAFTLEFLELYHQIRRRQSSFSVQAITRVVCSLHNIKYTNTLRNQLSNAFDVYLEILRNVRQQIEQVLGRGGDWKLKHGCAPCGWKLENEQELIPSRLHAIDGNNSLKRLDRAGIADNREFRSDLVIPHADVENFKNDVPRRARKKDIAPKPATISESTPVEGDESFCTQNWIAANVVGEETVKVFDQTGVFACVCRHAIVEMVVEMRKSGELAKYGLATLNKMLKVLEAHQRVGYDIRCAFCKTVDTSSLKDAAKDMDLKFVVDLFHGHAHNRLCQLNNLPLYIPGCGIEDFATCERVFAASNSVARVVRHASHYHWLQFIDLHYDQWNQDRYQDLSKFLYDNYRQATQIISAYTPDIRTLQTSLKITDNDFAKWHQEERDYLNARLKDPEYDPLKIAYVKAREEAAETQGLYDAVMSTPSFHAYNSDSGTMTAEEKRNTQKISNDRDHLRRKLILLEDAVKAAEGPLKIVTPWKPDSSEYKLALDFIRNKRFHNVVQKLEGLVVQRLFELAKANLSQTCYKMRRHISKAITKRSAAIRTALTRYNELAPLQQPPRPILAYEEVISYTVLGEFDLLKFFRSDVLEKPWSKSLNREVAAKYFKTVRAEEEKVRLNVETARLAAWIQHDEQELQRIAMQLQSSNPGLSYQVQRMYLRQRRINDVHRDFIQRIYDLPGFTGTRTERNSNEEDKQDGKDKKDEGLGGELDKEDDDADVAEDDVLADEMQRLGEYMDNIVL